MDLNEDRKRRVVVIGDIWTDTIMVPVSEKNSGLASGGTSRPLHGFPLEVFKVPVGAWLVRDILKTLPNKTNGVEVFSYPEVILENLSYSDMSHSLAEGEVGTDKNAADTVYIKRVLGYPGHGPDNGVPAIAKEFASGYPPVTQGQENMIVLDDAGLGFRDTSNSWETILNCAIPNKDTIIIYNMSGPLFTGPLWDALCQKELLQRLILIIDADALRDEGVNISRKLSWDRTIADFITIMGYKKYDRFAMCPHILVRFGLEGVLYSYQSIEPSQEKIRKTRMFFIPQMGENEIIENATGKMNGLSSAFVGLLARQIVGADDMTGPLIEILTEAVPVAAQQVMQLFKAGYKKVNNALQYPIEAAITAKSAGLFKRLDLINQRIGYLESSRKAWDILSYQIPLDYQLKDIATEYVLKGKVKELENVPMGQFGKLQTVDKNEIENFRSIKNLIKEYLEDRSITKPLPIAVFGPPGAGKSFAVKSVVNAEMEMILKKKADVLEYNISQFDSLLDLIRVFHDARDYSLKGLVPLVFFDEFDSSYKNELLGWLKYFLAPMQDGEFKDGEKVHPLGRSILVFAGGTSRSLQEFSRENDLNRKESDDYRRFISAKGPDFVSRLKGYVNILGPNPINPDNQQDTAPYLDRFFIIRRAVLLRALLEQQKNLIGEDRTIRIDEDVLRALLEIPKYKHGARSMAALINMSMLCGRNRFEKAALPTPQQLRLHVDAEVFMNIIDRDLIINVASIDRAIHETYCTMKKEEATAANLPNPEVPVWEKLPDDMKRLNRLLAENIPFYLLLINCSYRTNTMAVSMGNEKLVTPFTEMEVNYIARMAHECWMHEKCKEGWIYGETRDDENKIHNCINSWEELSEELKAVDKNTIKSLPRILRTAGFEIYRID